MRSDAVAARRRRVFVQARMSSARFPGKVLAPFRGRPLIASVIERAAAALGRDAVVVATSTDAADDPLALYVRSLHVAVFRGALDDVLGRMQACLAAYPCDWFCRICADSPLVDAQLILEMMSYTNRDDLDLVTNVFPRTFPRGLSVEWIEATRFAGLQAEALGRDAREHVTRAYYDNPESFRILNVPARGPSREDASLAVDTLDDLRRLESLRGIDVG